MLIETGMKQFFHRHNQYHYFKCVVSRLIATKYQLFRAWQRNMLDVSVFS